MHAGPSASTPTAPGPAGARTLSATPAGIAPPAPSPPALRKAVLGLLLALLVLGLAWELVLAPTGQRTLALKVLPLALALPGVWRDRLYTLRWLSLAVWLYVLEGLLRATTERGVSMVLAATEVVLAVALFAFATAAIRRRLRTAAEAGGAA